ncbi:MULTISPECIES: substrate-binding protein [Pseudomonadaceae]|jgi:ABC-type branched-subunit amino acid transport system substrate-binding protein|uniref:Amino acid/amide ABC transporter substrate-binding protein, HAAT family n=2 Tax=Ectopseudomonas TaxID=3236654 RepID=A4XS25_ECTM1|nr:MULTISPECIES: substrate-binding protein [Pseudomonas]ARS49918.1 branched-chain amino acid ABC transporter substrate-binding protein [Pseudomonas mendocina]EJO93089.1 extracellular ligand-binding receptor [Pseudomonas mendocina DLHK]ATH81342.1 branched-chain amino acid ABC transporter substrate-binding protein [Pseudomonas mendocina]MBA4245682.1 high-affinity branched-chain amino acid ABC transporter substrate-binding protein [Pseudomonas sp.]MBF8163386.1 substrate-binding protein [Pseudomon
MRQLTAILALWAGVTACVQAAEPITLGLNYPRTGPYKEEGLAQMRGALLAIDEINAAGGVLGRPLRLSSKDTASRPAKAEKNVDKLAAEGAVMLFGGASSAVAIAAGKRAKQHGLLYFGTLTYSNDTTGKDGHRYMFRECNNAWMSAKVLGQYLSKTLPNKRYFYVTADYTWGHTSEASLRQATSSDNAAQHAGVRVPFPGARLADYQDALTQAAASKADILALVLFGEDLVRAMRIAKDLGLTERMQIVAPNLTQSMVEQAGPDLMQGVIGTEPWTWRVPALEKSARGEAFVQAFKTRYQMYPSSSAASAYSIVQQWADAAKRANSLDSEALIKALEGHRYSLLKGEQQWRAFDHQNLQTVYAVKVKPRDEVLKDPLKQDYFEIVDRLDASTALPSLADWQAERRAGGQPLTLQ